MLKLWMMQRGLGFVGGAGALAATTHERTAAAAVTGAAASTTPQLSERTSQPLTAARQPGARGGGLEVVDECEVVACRTADEGGVGP